VQHTLECELIHPFVLIESAMVSISRVCRNGAKIDLLIMIAVGFGLSEALTISGGAKMVAGVSYGTATL
jgi:di/tricarboxylate transporter